MFMGPRSTNGTKHGIIFGFLERFGQYKGYVFREGDLNRRFNPTQRGSGFEWRNILDIPILMSDSTMWCVLFESDSSIIINPSDNVRPYVQVAVVLSVWVCLYHDSVAYLVSVGNTFLVLPSVVMSDQVLFPILYKLPVRFEMDVV